MSKKKKAHVTDPVVKLESKTKTFERTAFFAQACLTAKQWSKLRSWVRENKTSIECAQAFEVVDAAKKITTPEDGFTLCRVGNKLIDRHTIGEACKLEGVEFKPDN